ncbi:MAG: hypothetical protein NTW19_06625 [Planctomycetota bacterium]|nr:hypothetical protein [Planctomycetota bacterium]
MTNLTPRDLLFTHIQWEGPYDRASRAATGELLAVRVDGPGEPVVRTIKSFDAGASAHGSVGGTWVYLQSSLSGDSQIYRCRADGSGLENLTRTTGIDEYGFSFSPDQRFITYCSHRRGTPADVKMMTADGRDHRMLMSGPYSYMPRFAPDGRSVVCVSLRPSYGVHRIDLATGGDTCLIREAGVDFHNPCPSPDGKYITCYRRPNGVGGVSEVFRIDADGSNPLALTRGNMHEVSKIGSARGGSDPPAWSPDAQRLAFVTGDDEQLHTMNPDGGDVRKLTSLAGTCAFPRWSADGGTIAFAAEVNERPQLFVIPAAGGQPRQLTRLPGAVFWPNWC